MHRALPILAILSVLATARAQTQSPEVSSLRLPLSLHGAIERDTEHGCSQSFESVSAHATVQLDIDATSAAHLVLDGRHFVNVGPSFGRYQAGDHEFSQITELHRTTWSGHATILADGITITLDHAERAEVRFTGYGTLPLPSPTVEAFSGQVHCAIARADVLPAEAAAGEVPTSMALLSCTWVGSTDAPFDRYLDEGDPIVLGSGAGVRDLTSRSMWGYSTERSVRLTP